MALPARPGRQGTGPPCRDSVPGPTPLPYTQAFCCACSRMRWTDSRRACSPIMGGGGATDVSLAPVCTNS
jgi:hypothetical protein